MIYPTWDVKASIEAHLPGTEVDIDHSEHRVRVTVTRTAAYDFLPSTPNTSAVRQVVDAWRHNEPQRGTPTQRQPIARRLRALRDAIDGLLGDM